MLKRLSIRLRLTLAFALAMALLLGATGYFVHNRLESSLSDSLTRSLKAEAAGEVDELPPKPGPAEGYTQLINAGGRIARSSPRLRETPLLSPAQLARARHGTIVVERPAPRGFGDDPWRVLARPAVADGSLVVAAGASLEPNESALGDLFRELLLGGAAALVLSSLASYLLAAAALRPVEAMSRRAAEISLTGGDRRLPVPETHDEISNLGARLNDMLARIEASMAHERRFLTDASHELRTPLAILKTELEIALSRKRSPDELERVLRSAREEADRLAKLAEDLLFVARADQSAIPVRPAQSRAGEILAGVADRFSTRAVEAGRRIQVESPNGLELICDPARVSQALDNLVDNALRHGGGTITLCASQENGFVELHVRDEGAGFPPAFLPRAFERFSRADEARTSGGSGLGLAIVAAIARAHGGQAGAAGRAGGGSDVWLALPKEVV